MFSILFYSFTSIAQETPNARQARRLFNETYQMVYGQ